FIQTALDTIRDHYALTQRRLYEGGGWTYQHKGQHVSQVLGEGQFRFSRHSVRGRTGPYMLSNAARRHYHYGTPGSEFPQLPRIRDSDVTKGEAHSWANSVPL